MIRRSSLELFAAVSRLLTRAKRTLFFSCLMSVAALSSSGSCQAADAKDLPKVAEGFSISFAAKEPLVSNPCAMAFDAEGRLCVGMGPQYRNPTPQTPGDSVYIMIDRDGDGVFEDKKKFATGFNCIQGLAWHGDDLWIANAPDLTIVRDLDGDDVADRYTLLYTDLGNLEHGLHGLNWGPDGRMYMSKGNSKGLTKPGRIAPLPFRQLWGVSAPAGTPDFPEPIVTSPAEYKHAFHNPADDWGREGGVLACDNDGANLEIISRGYRNPWDIAFDDGFNFQGTDNDQNEGDRVFMPFFGSHFGWGHPWSAHWSGENHLPTAPITGSVFHGSGTGIVYFDEPTFPPEYRGVWFFNDWLNRTTYMYRPKWDGALIQPDGGAWQPFVTSNKTLFKPTDIAVGPDGALYILGWGNEYGVKWNDKKEQVNEGRIYRVTYKRTRHQNAAESAKRLKPIGRWSINELVEDFGSPLPIWRSNAQEELIGRGDRIVRPLLDLLATGNIPIAQETWIIWTIGRIDLESAICATELERMAKNKTGSPNSRVQALRVMAYRASRAGSAISEEALSQCLSDREPRVRLAAVQATRRANVKELVDNLAGVASLESDRVVFYATWQAIRVMATPDKVVALLSSPRAGTRLAALLALAEDRVLEPAVVQPLLSDKDDRVRGIAALWLAKSGGNSGGNRVGSVVGEDYKIVAASELAQRSGVYAAKAKSGHDYRIVEGGLQSGQLAYTDRNYRFKTIPNELIGAMVVQTANEDSGSTGSNFLTLRAVIPTRVFVGHDTRVAEPPGWLTDKTIGFIKTGHRVTTNDANFVLYEKTFPAGEIKVGGNGEDGNSGGKSNYVVIVQPMAIPELKTATTVAKSLQLLENADAIRGKALFFVSVGAGCVKCHRADASGKSFGPDLQHLVKGNDAKHVMTSILQPSAHIKEGFTTQQIVTVAGKAVNGILKEQTADAITLLQPEGTTVVVKLSDIDERTSSKVSPMPAYDHLLQPQQVADITKWLLDEKVDASDNRVEEETKGETPRPERVADTRPANGPRPAAPKETYSANASRPISFKKSDGSVQIFDGEVAIATYYYADAKTSRPFFAHVRTPNGEQVTRNHPPQKGDPSDHADYHPGIFLAFGDISGNDYWRLQAKCVHDGFVEEPKTGLGKAGFTVRNRYQSAAGKSTVCIETCRYEFHARPNGVLLTTTSKFTSNEDFYFGDQEEMGLGVRVASPIREDGGNGQITNSMGLTSAQRTWGRPAEWCDYSGAINGRQVGVTIFGSPKNQRESWWHNRGYGVFVANMFGRQAMRQGPPSRIEVSGGEAFHLGYGVMWHSTRSKSEYDPKSEYAYYFSLEIQR
ncbi:MAG: putative membrane-bound dehydrogenase-like protein [Pirellulaceae bacterium]